MESYNSVKNGIVKFLDNEFISKMPNNNKMAKVLIGVGIGIAIERADNIAKELMNNKMLLSMGIVDSKGNIDVDILVKHLKNQMGNEAITFTVPMLSKFVGDVTITKDDVDKLYEYILEG